MSNCVRCKKSFRDQYTLHRHQSRINQCKEVFVEIQPLADPKDTLADPKNTLDDPKNTLAECQWCLNLFSNKSNLNKHENVCKQIDDPVRLLEIKQNIKIKLPDSKLECRFCNKNLCRIDVLHKHLKTCTSRNEYHEKLKKQKNIYTTINNNINNGTVNNINIVLNWNQENNQHINNKDLEKIYNLAKRDHQSALMVANSSL